MLPPLGNDGQSAPLFAVESASSLNFLSRRGNLLQPFPLPERLTGPTNARGCSLAGSISASSSSQIIDSEIKHGFYHLFLLFSPGCYVDI